MFGVPIGVLRGVGLSVACGGDGLAMGDLDPALRNGTVCHKRSLGTHRVGGDIDALHILLHATQVLIFFAQVVI